MGLDRGLNSSSTNPLGIDDDDYTATTRGAQGPQGEAGSSTQDYIDKYNTVVSSAASASVNEANSAASASASATASTAASASASSSLASANSATSSATLATTKASNAGTSATNSANSATSSANSASASSASASSSASNASVATTQAGISATKASEAVTTAANSAASATSSATSETNAGTSETNAAASATASASSAANALSSQNASSGSEVNASNSATAAATSASTATTQASTATTKAAEALASQTASAANASASAVSATAAETAETAAELSKTAAESSETAAELSKAAALVSQTAAAASQVSATASASSASTSASEALASKLAAASSANDINVAAIAATKAVTAVDVFVYDTSKDSDGGAWRKRTQGTSWYNETLNTSTRGSRKEFPAVAVIVAENLKVTIYDGDDPAMPMWMVFNLVQVDFTVANLVADGSSGTVKAVTMNNGYMVLAVGGTANGGAIKLNFLTEISRYYRTIGSSYTGAIYQGNISKRNNGKGYIGNEQEFAIVNADANDVAMTVLPNAPIDSATGLPIPTIAIASDGGISVIKDDGSVVDIVNSNSSFNVCHSITLNESGRLSFVNGYSLGINSWVYVFNSLPTADNVITINTKTGSTQNADAMYDARGASSVAEDLVLIGGQDDINATTERAVGVTAGLTLLDENTTTPSEGSVAYITSDYNTGYMVGDIKLAALSDTDDTDVVGSELVTNGTFDTDLTGWTDISVGTGSASVTSGQLELIRTDINNRGFITQALTVVVGATYVLQITEVSGSAYVGVGYTDVGTTYLAEVLATGVNTYQFTPTGTTVYVNVRGVADGTQVVDNISVRLADADRSVNANGLQVHGTITKNPVATGADLVAYSGFSATNYLEQPYNSDLDFGTGDFSYMGWVKMGSITYETMLDRYDGSTTATWFNIIKLNGALAAYIGGWKISSFTMPSGSWIFVVASRKSGVFTLHADGEQVYSVASTTNITSSGAVLSAGRSAQNTWYLADGSMALWRISATAPSAQQIKDIYEAEKPLFQDGAQATLYGTSDAVTALAHDSESNLLHVGTSSGRSVFSGLRRVDNTTTAVGAAISTSNNLVVED